MSSHVAVNDSLPSTLLERLQQREPDAWNRLARLYGPMIYEWCRRSGLSPVDAADLDQDVLLAIWKSIASFRRERPDSTFRGWVITITRNKITDHFRKAAKQPHARGGSDGMLWIDSLASEGSPSSSDAQSTNDNSKLVRRAAELIRGEFEPASWNAFWMTAVDDVPATDVAERLGSSLNAVYKARSRVLQRLRRELDGLL